MAARGRLQPDGKIVVVGYRSDGSKEDFALVRYQSDGSLDDSFGSGGVVTTAVGSAMDRSGPVASSRMARSWLPAFPYSASTLEFAVARYDADGSLDTSFGGDGTDTTDLGVATEARVDRRMQPDDKIVTAGSSRT